MPMTHKTTPYEASVSELSRVMAWTPGRVVVMDIRERSAYEQGHIPGAKNVALEEVAAECERLSRDQVIVVYCGDVTCGLALNAAMELAQNGYCARYLRGGMAEWERRGLPMEASRTAPTARA
jgi:rhodanese-related sulfurtransferase